ncbi:unnamed protein product [Sphagnum balticum]
MRVVGRRLKPYGSTTGRCRRVAVKEKVVAKKRRPDEYHKLFYRRAFKFAEKEFFKRGRKNKRKMSAFYHHHFEGVAQKLSVPLINFYHPDKKIRPGMKAAQKSFNLAYVKLLLRSPSFRDTTSRYQHFFRDECMQERSSKIAKLSSYLARIFDANPTEPKKAIAALKSSKCKIPWSDLDIEEADRRAAWELKGGGLSTPDELKQEENGEDEGMLIEFGEMAKMEEGSES